MRRWAKVRRRTTSAYIGDSRIGRDVNVGAGVVTCNYDGANKNTTVIGDNAFIGSGVMLVAPVTVHAGATIGAGSTIGKGRAARRPDRDPGAAEDLPGLEAPAQGLNRARVPGQICR